MVVEFRCGAIASKAGPRAAQHIFVSLQKTGSPSDCAWERSAWLT